MAQLDAERGERIEWLRTTKLHLTQDKLADEVGVTLRAYQLWAAGGGIKWDHVKKLAELAGAEPDWIMSGDRITTPDLAADQPALDDLRTEIAAMRQELGAALAAITEMRQMLSQRLGTQAPRRPSRKVK